MLCTVPFGIVALAISCMYTAEATEIIQNNDSLNQEIHLFKELAYRLDLVDCSSSAPLPAANKQVKYFARPSYNCSDGSIKCHSQRIGNPRRLRFHKGTVSIRPSKSNGKYKRERLQYFNVQCPEGTHGSILSANIDLQDRVMLGGKSVCLDYLSLVNTQKNSFYEFCGKDEIPTDFPKFEDLLIVFRSGRYEERTGFNIIISCTPTQVNQMNCLQQSDEMSVEEYLLSDAEKGLGYFEEYDEIQNQRGKLIPYGAKQELLNFFVDRYDGRAVSNSIYSYNDIIKLATVSEKSCDPQLMTIAQSVLDLFPVEMIMQANYHQNTAFNADYYK